MSEDVTKVLVSAPLIKDLDDDKFEDFCKSEFDVTVDDLYDLWCALEPGRIVPAVDSYRVQGLVCMFYIGKTSDGSFYHETNLPLPELMSIISQMTDFGCDLNEVKVQSYTYYNGVEEPFYF